MKTLTEFSGFTLKEAMAKKAALITEGKTEEEAQAAINEQLKLDEAKAPFYKNVVDMTASRIATVKRVVVAVKATETETVPTAFVEREGHFYLVEYFPQAGSANRTSSRDDDRDFGRGRGGRGGNDRGRGRGDGGGRGRGDGERRPPREFSNDGPREPRAPRAPAGGPTSALIQTANANAPRTSTMPPRDKKQERAPRPPRGDRPAREPRAPRGPKGAGELRLVLKGSTQTLQGSAPAVAPTETATTDQGTPPQA